MSRRMWRRTRSQVRAEVEEELEYHLAARVAELERRGLSPIEARREAMRRLGDRAEVVRGCVSIDLRRERRARRREWSGDVVQDTRLGVRQLMRRPALALVSVLTLGLAIGAATSIYAVADHVLLRPLPYAGPQRIVTVWETDQLNGGARAGVSPANYLDLEEAAVSFSALALITPFSLDVAGDDGPPEALRTWHVTAGFFDALGVKPVIGRTFTAEEYQPSGPAVTLLSYGLWQRRFGGDARAVGRMMTLDGVPTEILGVLPPSLEYPEPRDLVLPKHYLPEELTDRRSAFMFAVARLRPGVTLEQAQSELDGIAARMADEHAAFSRRGFAAVPLRAAVFGETRPAVTAMLGAVAILLLIACANLANVLIARGMDRRAELAVRGALGAGRARLARQLMTESLVLAAAGGVVGTAVAWVGIRLLIALAPADLPRLSAVALDARVLAFALSTTLLTAVLFGLAPALRLSRQDLMGTMRAAGSSREHSRLRGALVAGQVSLCVVLLVGAGLLGRSMVRLLDNELGFAAENRATLQLFLWDNVPSDAQRVERVRELIERFEALPGVEHAGAVSALPFHPSPITARGGLLISGAPPVQPGEEPRVLASIATPSYFDVMGVPLRRGRMFDDDDRSGAPDVAIISERLAAEYFPGVDPVGRRVRIGVMSAPAEREIIGVIGDVRPSAFDSEPAPELFIPHAQSGSGSMTFVARTTYDAAAALTPLRNAVWSIDPNQSIYHAATLGELVGATLAQRRFQLLLSGVFAALALGLVMLGIYGVISLWARQRTVEFGVRIALGARAGQITRLVLVQAMRLALPGIAAGLLAAILITRWIEHLLYGIAPTDALTLVHVTVLVAIVAAVAAYVPARAATARDAARLIRSP